MTWSGPVDVGSHSLEDFGGDITAQLTGATPVLTVASGGGTVIQQGLGVGSLTVPLDPPSGPIGGMNSALDAQTGEVVTSWYTPAGHGGLWYKGVAPAHQPAKEAFGNFDRWGDQQRQLSLAGLDNGPGVFTAYSPDGTHVRLLRSFGTWVGVGPVQSGVAQEVDVATGPDGRVWVMWGDAKGPGSRIEITRSKRAKTKFEPVQRFDYNVSALWRLGGDGRLGPLDLLINMTPRSPGAEPAGIYYAHVLPRLSATVSSTKAKPGKFLLTVKATDAGNPVSGTTVSAQGLHAKTKPVGVAKLTVHGSAGNRVTVTVTAPGYEALTARVTL